MIWQTQICVNNRDVTPLNLNLNKTRGGTKMGDQVREDYTYDDHDWISEDLLVF